MDAAPPNVPISDPNEPGYWLDRPSTAAGKAVAWRLLMSAVAHTKHGPGA